MAQTIYIKTRKPKLMTCDICGKTDETVDMYIGPFNHLCPKCEEIANKVIEGYLRFLINLPFRVVINELNAHICKEEGLKQKT